MNIITIFNYPDEEKYNTMFKNWVLLALQSKYKTKNIKFIKIFTEGINNKLKTFIQKLNTNDIKIEIKDRIKLINVPHRWLHNVGFKLYNLCNENEPFVFVDADAMIMTDMNDVIKASKDKPFISVNHQTIPLHTDKFKFKFMNTGFFIVSQPEFLDFNTIYNTPKIFQCPGTDQFLLNNYCRYIKYDYTHELIHFGWNSCGGYKTKINNKIYSYKLPEEHQIHILHYWDVFKPWITPCKIYNEISQQNYLFEKILDKIKFNNLQNVINIFYNNKDLYCHKDIFNYVKILNFKNKTFLIDENKQKLDNINFISEL